MYNRKLKKYQNVGRTFARMILTESAAQASSKSDAMRRETAVARAHRPPCDIIRKRGPLKIHAPLVTRHSSLVTQV